MDSLHMDQADSDFFVLAELIKDYIQLIGAVKVGKEEGWRKISMTAQMHPRSAVIIWEDSEEFPFFLLSINYT